MPLIGIAVTSAARTIGHWISFGVTLAMMLGLCGFLFKQKKSRFGTKCHVNGPLILTMMAALLIMVEPIRHALQDSNVWPEVKVDHLSDTYGVGLAFDTQRSILLLPDTQTISSVAEENLYRIHRLKYADGKVSEKLSSIENLTTTPTAVYYDKGTDAYYIGTNEYISKYEPTTQILNETWCKLEHEGTTTTTLGMSADSTQLFIAGGLANVVSKCRLSDGVQLPDIYCGGSSNTSSINDLVYDDATNVVYVTFGSDPTANKDTNSTAPPSGVLKIDAKGVVTKVVGDGERGIDNANNIQLDDKWIVVTQNPGSRVYNIEKSTNTILAYNDISTDIKPNILGMTVSASGSYIIAANNSEVVMYDFDFIGSGQYVHDPSRNCISSNNEKMRCLTTLGAFTTLVCTYTGFILLAVGTMWNANLVSKLKDARDKWRELRA